MMTNQLFPAVVAVMMRSGCQLKKFRFVLHSVPTYVTTHHILNSAGITEGFSMCGGDFVEVYNDVDQEASWDAVVTCFFLDTAHNIAEYIEVISKILKEGGVWINLGPLLYHFADSYGPEEEMSIEISLEDVIKIALQYGFVFFCVDTADGENGSYHIYCESPVYDAEPLLYCLLDYEEETEDMISSHLKLQSRACRTAQRIPHEAEVCGGARVLEIYSWRQFGIADPVQSPPLAIVSDQEIVVWLV
ncbi:hypothetical protein KSP40_PGU011395 [Platanthera guangdongensis]|uniref:carnosine N-methyltransferase n=1 Tax=Platanthera guangdongensis TaxID=2320717 RepID=A0ABR2MB29_9ASPA